MVADVVDIVIEANEVAVALTVITALLLTIVPTFKVILAVPADTPVTNPDKPSTVATELLSLDHENCAVGHAIVLPFWSLHTAVSGEVPAMPTVADAGDIVMVVSVVAAGCIVIA